MTSFVQSKIEWVNHWIQFALRFHSIVFFIANNLPLVCFRQQPRIQRHRCWNPIFLIWRCTKRELNPRFVWRIGRTAAHDYKYIYIYTYVLYIVYYHLYKYIFIHDLFCFINLRYSQIIFATYPSVTPRSEWMMNVSFFILVTQQDTLNSLLVDLSVSGYFWRNWCEMAKWRGVRRSKNTIWTSKPWLVVTSFPFIRDYHDW